MAAPLRTSLLLSLLAALLLGAPAQARPPTTRDVWRHHIQAWIDQDVAAITADYTETSVLIVNHQVFHGKAAIGHAFSQLFQLFSRGENEPDPLTMTDHVVYITWRFAPKGETPLFGSDSLYIENGKIQAQTLASELFTPHPIKP